MEITRKIHISTTNIQVGDQIAVGKYTATCQKVAPGQALFLLDQYLDQDMQMNVINTNSGGYAASDLRAELNSDEILSIFSGLELLPIYEGDLLRLPYYGELFGHEDDWCEKHFEHDDAEQWPLMKEVVNRVAYRKGGYEWGWLMNRYVNSAPHFAICSDYGNANVNNASGSYGVRPAFLVRVS